MRSRVVVIGIVLALLAGASAARAGDGIQTVGNVLNITLPITAAVATVTHHDGVGAKQLAISLGVTLCVTYALKVSINETRPNGENYSFPSGHSSSSFASAEFMRRRYGWKWGAPAYAAAAFVAYSRVESRMHYTHDVVAGAALGVASSVIFAKPYRKWTATVGGDTSGVRFTLSRAW
jgi:membrane-associated phospholipid phosphatase